MTNIIPRIEARNELVTCRTLSFGELGLASHSIPSTTFCLYEGAFGGMTGAVKSGVLSRDQPRESRSHLGETRGKHLANLKKSNMGAFPLEDLTIHLGQPNCLEIPVLWGSQRTSQTRHTPNHPALAPEVSGDVKKSVMFE